MEGFRKETQETAMVAFWERGVELESGIRMDSLFITYPIVLFWFFLTKVLFYYIFLIYNFKKSGTINQVLGIAH